MGPRAVLEPVVNGKIPSPRRESNPRTPIVQPVVQRYNGKQKWRAVPLVRDVTDKQKQLKRANVLFSLKHSLTTVLLA